MAHQKKQTDSLGSPRAGSSAMIVDWAEDTFQPAGRVADIPLGLVMFLA